MSEVTESTRVVNFGGVLDQVRLPLAKSTVNETDTIVRVSDGNIVAIGGLMSVDVRDNRGGLPGVTEGGLGDLLRNTDRRSGKSELVILLKPTVIQSDRDWEQDLRADAPALRGAHAAGGPEVTMNYLKHFGLRELPFGITPDTSYFFACRSIQEALNTLLVAVANGEGFIKITGEVGTGKTLLCRKFLSTLSAELGERLHTESEPRAARPAARAGRGARRARRVAVEPHRLEKELMQRLLDIARQGKRVVLCMDETQAMPLATLETVRLLTNLETEKRKLMQVVLFGQPELDRKLASESVRQLRQRITFQYALKALGAQGSRRLRRAPPDHRRLFRRGAVRQRRAERAARGEPRRAAPGEHPRAQVAAARSTAKAGARSSAATCAARSRTRLRPARRWWWWSRPRSTEAA